MKRLAILLATAAIATPALAADVVYQEPPAPAPVSIEPVTQTTTWTGLYVGAQAGVAFGNSDNGASFNTSNGTGGSGIFNGDDSNSGFIGGGTIGYDYQMGNFVVGALADINYIDASESRSYTTGLGNTFTTNSDINYLGTVRAKLGYAMDNVLVYGTGGLAYAGLDNSMTSPSNTSGRSSPATASTRAATTTTSATPSARGVDFMATQNISFGVEYLYTNLGSNDQTITGTSANGLNTVSFSNESNNNDLDFHTVWAKAAYHFN